MRNDVLSLAGPDQNTRGQLYDFIVEELAKRQSLCPHRIAGVLSLMSGEAFDVIVLGEKKQGQMDGGERFLQAYAGRSEHLSG